MKNETFFQALQWLCLVIAPLILVTIELFHPASFTWVLEKVVAFEYLRQEEISPHSHGHKALAYFGPDWWFWLHMIQTPLVGLVGVGMWLLVGRVIDLDGPYALLSAWVSRAATFMFVIYYTALDAIGGFGLARTIEIVNGRDPKFGCVPSEKIPCFDDSQISAVSTLINDTWTDPWVGGVGSFVSHTGSYAVLAAAVFAALALSFGKRYPWAILVLLAVFGWQVQESHTAYHGPIGFGALAIAGFWLLFTEYRAQRAGGGIGLDTLRS